LSRPRRHVGAASEAASQATPQGLGFALAGLVFGGWRKA
jgi:hypothetical protein